MRVFLTKPELEIGAGTELLELCLRITADEKLDLEEIKTLRRWLRTNRETTTIAAIPYLDDIMTRVTADGIIDRDELLELHLAVERVIPTACREPAIQARKKREAERRERHRELRRIEREREAEERKREREEEAALLMRLRHAFAKVAGVTFPNDDGSERQEIIARCKSGESLRLKQDAYNQYSVFATQVLRSNGEQIGHAPEYLAERICDEIDSGYKVVGVLLEVTGGTWDKPTRGVNFAVFFFAEDVAFDELSGYMKNVLATRGGCAP